MRKITALSPYQERRGHAKAQRQTSVVEHDGDGCGRGGVLQDFPACHHLLLVLSFQ